MQQILIYCTCIPEQPDLVDFLFVVDILWNYDISNMLGFMNQVIGNYGMMVHEYFYEL